MIVNSLCGHWRIIGNQSITLIFRINLVSSLLKIADQTADITCFSETKELKVNGHFCWRTIDGEIHPSTIFRGRFNSGKDEPLLYVNYIVNRIGSILAASSLVWLDRITIEALDQRDRIMEWQYRVKIEVR
jgi:hypothetical protein